MLCYFNGGEANFNDFIYMLGSLIMSFVCGIIIWKWNKEYISLLRCKIKTYERLKSLLHYIASAAPFTCACKEVQTVECKEVDFELYTATGRTKGEHTHTHIDRKTLHRTLYFPHSTVRGARESTAPFRQGHNAAACCTTPTLTALDQKS